MNSSASAHLADKAQAAQAQAAVLRERLRGLKPAQAEMMRRAMRLHAAGDKLMSAQRMLQVAREAAEHLSRLATQPPHDLTAWCTLGVARGRADDDGAAQHSLQEAARCASNPAQWLKLAVQSDGLGLSDDALQAAGALLALDPCSPLGLLERVRCHKALGRTAAAAADCRALITQGSEVAKAWFSLVDLKTVALSDAERQQLQQTALNPNLSAAEQQLLDFALGKVQEDAADPAGALKALQRANTSVRATQPWDTPKPSPRTPQRGATWLRQGCWRGPPTRAAR